MSDALISALPNPYWSCHSCNLLVHAVPPDMEEAHASCYCPRCGALLHKRKPHSVARTWALIIAAILLYLPANLLPVMASSGLGSVQEDTILSGVIYLFKSGMWPLALLVFFASIVVPLVKLLILIVLLLSVQLRWSWRPRERTRLYRITEAIGRWSMVDIYVVTILVALVHVGILANVEAGLGAVFFGGVVVMTMFAATSFDPRLIWDALPKSHD